MDVLTPFPLFAHFSINDLEWFDYFFAFAKHLQRLGVIETPVVLEDRPVIDFSERITYKLQNKIQAIARCPKCYFHYVFEDKSCQSENLMSFRRLHFSMNAFFFNFCGLQKQRFLEPLAITFQQPHHFSCPALLLDICLYVVI